MKIKKRVKIKQYIWTLIGRILYRIGYLKD